MKAVILCGGLGTRLRPLTYEIPKNLIPVQGKPVLEHLLDLFKREGIHDVFLSVGYKKEKIMEHFGDGRKVGMNISYLEENSPLGTAGPLKMLPLQTEPFVVSNGDELKDVDLKAMLTLHQKTNALVTIALTQVDRPEEYGVARLDGNRILEFIEKPVSPPTNLVNAGLYILEPEVLQKIPEGRSMLEKDVFPHIAQQGRLTGFPFKGQWFDTGSMERWERAMNHWKGIHFSNHRL